MLWRHFRRSSRRIMLVFALTFCFLGFYIIFSASKLSLVHEKEQKGMMFGVFIGNNAQEIQTCLFFPILVTKSRTVP